ncbi:hypothetical protein [Pseudonocardia sp. WMMC193]|uniref:hypothetical protein n=1 Tax=Pseudonocardia sp. WMMC193 TaxID=2911965 RepID=UPI001F39E044|nr:hypothetical protein [Pseudonocardia sp. WMMC193]MCF7552210.1 hypothetical protein [Pseudonocardia sp. WMMC193]
MNDSTTPESSPGDSGSQQPGKGKWAQLTPMPREHRPHPRDNRPSEYGLPIDMGEHPLRTFYREIREEEEAEARRRARAIDRQHPTGDAR